MKLCVASFSDWRKNNQIKKKIYQAHFSSVSELEKYYNAKERKDAWTAWKFIKRSLAGSKDETIRLATFGNILNVPFTKTDIIRASEIYGKPIETIPTRMTKKKNRKSGHCTDKSLGRKTIRVDNRYLVY